MADTSILSVGGFGSLGQGTQSLTGNSEDDLKIQFAQVMSELTSQVGTGTYSNGQTTAQNVANLTNSAKGTADYERYSSVRSEIKNASAQENTSQDTVKEKLESYGEEVKDILKEELGVTEEEITEAMQLLGLTMADLIMPNQLANLTAALAGCEDVGELLCSDGFVEVLGEIGTLSKNLLEELNMTQEEFLDAAAMTENPMLAEDFGLEENKAAAEPLLGDTVPQDGNGALETDKTGLEAAENVSDVPITDEQASKETFAVQNETAKELETHFAEKTQLESDFGEKTQPEEDGFAETVTQGEPIHTESDKQQADSQNASGNEANQAAFVKSEQQIDVSAAKTVEPGMEFSKQLDTIDLIKQVTDFTRVTLRETQTTMQMQLNPEHLGKLYIEVTAKEGNVSAHIVTQNEIVKEALETQLAELKQSMNEAGVKVDAVEVTVGSHEFEKNLEQNAKQQEKQAEEQEKMTQGTRKIKLDDLDELSQMMSEEETLIAQIMADHGNSVDFTA